MVRVIIESPYAGNSREEIDQHEQYARACLKDCLLRGEAPFASHLLYTQEGVLDDRDPEERKLGIEAGLVWGAMAKQTIVYTDHGITPGMQKGINRAQEEGRPVVYRSLGP